MTNKLLFLALIIAAYACSSEQKEASQQVDIDSALRFSLPFPDITVKDTVYHINTATDTVVTYWTGSSIQIPQGAFVDSTGAVITGAVDLHYSEFHSPLDIYLAGIPMVYDSAGTNYVFETAGMIRIEASYQKRRVYVNPQKKILVDLVSSDSATNYGNYILDKKTKKWQYVGKSNVSVSSLADDTASLPKLPPRPKIATGNSFSIGDATGDYSELDAYKNVLFEPIDGKYHGFTSTEMKVLDCGNGIYRVTFIMDAYGVHKEESCNCYLAFEKGKDYSEAMQVYQTRYKSEIAARAKRKEEIIRQWAEYAAIRRQYSAMGLLDTFGAAKIVRSLTIQNFGFVNCDRVELFRGACLTATFVDQSGNVLDLKNIVLAIKGRNALCHLVKTVQFNPSLENILWGITPDNKLAYFKADDFKKITQTSGNYTFAMTVHSKQLRTYKEIRDVLFE